MPITAITIPKGGMKVPDFDNLQKRKNSFAILNTDLNNWEEYAKEGFYITQDLFMSCFYCDLTFFCLSNIDKRYDQHHKECLFAKCQLIDTQQYLGEEDPENPCQICCSRNINFLFLPCCHLSTCEKCCYKFHQCFVCRGKIKSVSIVFL